MNTMIAERYLKHLPKRSKNRRLLVLLEAFHTNPQLASIAKCPIDLIDMRVVGEPILGDILTKGERILGSDTDFALLLSRYLIDKADFYPYREWLLQERQERWIRD